MKILAVIPARYASQRFPGKPLAYLRKKPLIQWVYEAAKSCSEFDQVIVATDHDDIFQCVTDFGGQVEWTEATHPSGTDRVAEVASRHTDSDVVVNVQGDQPFITPSILTQLVQPFFNEEKAQVTTIASPITSQDSISNPNIVKVVCNQRSEALYFSRSVIPYFRYPGEVPVYQHLGLYAFKRDFLNQFTTLPSTPLERCEALEQLRILEHGFYIRVCMTQKPILEVNTPEDLKLAHEYLDTL